MTSTPVKCDTVYRKLKSWPHNRKSKNTNNFCFMQNHSTSKIGSYSLFLVFSLSARIFFYSAFFFFLFWLIAFPTLMSHKISPQYFSPSIIFSIDFSLLCIFMCLSFTLPMFSLWLLFIPFFKKYFFLCSYSSLPFPILLPSFLWFFVVVVLPFFSSYNAS